MKLKRALWVLAATAVAYAPGFAFPFVLALVADNEFSDVTLAAFSIAITIGSIVGLSVENAWAAYVSNLRVRRITVTWDAVRIGERRAILVGLLLTLVLVPVYSITYLAAPNLDRRDLVPSLVAVAAYPLIAGYSSVLSGVMNGYGRVATNLLLQGTRSTFPVLGVLLVGESAGPWSICVLLTVGEATRALALRIVCTAVVRSYSDGLGDHDTSEASPPSLASPPTLRAIAHHAGGLAILGSSPVIDRAFLASNGVGNVTRYEMADRVFFAGSQVGNTLLVLPRVAALARKIGSRGVRLGAVSEILRTFWLASAGAAVLATVVAGAAPFLPQEISDALPWASLLIASLPAAVAGTVATRAIVAAHRSSAIPQLAIMGVCVNVAGNIIGVMYLGAVGVVVSTVLLRYFLLAATILYLRLPSSQRAYENATLSGIN